MMYLYFLFTLAFVAPQFLEGTLFIERPATRERINVSQPCIGYLELVDSVQNNRNFAGHLHQLLHNPLVEGILLVIDSGGGAVVDSFKLANMIKLANQQKPIVTYVSDTCASGAYLIACESSCIVASPMADIGSIGVAIEITKKEQDKFKRDGVSGKLKQFIFTRGKYKRLAEGPLDQLGADDEAHINANLDYLYEAFCTIVAEKRSLSLEVVKGTEASVFSAPLALEKGLIDQVGTIFDAVQALKNRMHKKGSLVETSTDLLASVITPSGTFVNYVQ